MLCKQHGLRPRSAGRNHIEEWRFIVQEDWKLTTEDTEVIETESGVKNQPCVATTP
jgi:hypothetical protein